MCGASYNDLGKGAWNGTAPVRNLPAILVRYGSGSLAKPMEKTFYVSGSGDTYIGGNLTSSLDVYIGGDCNIKGNVTSSQDFRIEGDLTVAGTINAGAGSGDGSRFQFLDTPVLLATITNAGTGLNAWKTYGGAGTYFASPYYSTARSAILYIEHNSNITAGFAVEIYYQFRRNNTKSAFKSNRLSMEAGNTGAYGTGNQVIVPLDYNNRSFDYYLNSTLVASSGTITLIGYLT